MKVYVIWQTKNKKDDKSHVIGVFKSKEDALKKYKTYKSNRDRDDGVNDDDNGGDDITMTTCNLDEMICDFTTINRTNDYYCTEIADVSDTKRLYFMKVHESKGGGSYHEISSLYVFSSYAEAQDMALDIFEREHNVEDECDLCHTNKCRTSLKNKLKATHSAAIVDCTYLECVVFNIWYIDL